MLYARRFPIRKGKLRVINTCWGVAAGARDHHRVASLIHGQFKMPCDINEMLQRQFYFFGTYLVEQSIIECWESAARFANVVFDVGANAGIFSLAALAVQPSITVHAFEPTPEIAARLRKTVTLNGLKRLHVHEVAVFKQNGQATLKRFRGETGTNEGMNFITTSLEDNGEERVETVSLDDFCRSLSIDYIDLLKIDIQGHEYSALAGAEGLIRDGRIGTIFTELNWAMPQGENCPATESVRLLSSAGYEFSEPGRIFHWRKAGDWLRCLSNVVARREPQG